MTTRCRFEGIGHWSLAALAATCWMPFASIGCRAPEHLDFGDSSTSETDASGEEETVVGDPGAYRVRRLTPEQYRQTVSELFPGAKLPSLAIVGNPPDGHLDHFAAKQDASSLWVSQVESAAARVAVVAGPEAKLAKQCVRESGGCRGDALSRLLQAFFRRPPTLDELDIYEKYLTSLSQVEDESAQVELVLLSLLQDPAFLYLTEVDDLALENPAKAQEVEVVAVGPYALASRLSYFLWNGPPDQELIDAASNRKLLELDELVDQAERMLDDGRAKQGLRAFASQVYELDKISAIVDKQNELAVLTPTLQADMREEAERNFFDIVRSKKLGIRDWLAGTKSWVSPELAGVYELSEQSEPWELRELPSDKRAGYLTSAGFLAAHAVNLDPAPVRRGVFVLSKLLCQEPPTPATSVTIVVPEAGNSLLTNRQRYEAHVSSPACAGCHQSIDGIGFGFENYDAAGQFRTQDMQEPVDASGRLMIGTREIEFEGAVELAQLLVEQPEVYECAVRWWLSYALARSIDEAEQPLLGSLTAKFMKSGGNFRQLILDIVASDAFRYKRSDEKI